MAGRTASPAHLGAQYPVIRYAFFLETPDCAFYVKKGGWFSQADVWQIPCPGQETMAGEGILGCIPTRISVFHSLYPEN